MADGCCSMSDSTDWAIVKCFDCNCYCIWHCCGCSYCVDDDCGVGYAAFRFVFWVCWGRDGAGWSERWYGGFAAGVGSAR